VADQINSNNHVIITPVCFLSGQIPLCVREVTPTTCAHEHCGWQHVHSGPLSWLCSLTQSVIGHFFHDVTCWQAEMNALKKTQEDLQKGRQKLDDMLQRLEREQVLVLIQDMLLLHDEN